MPVRFITGMGRALRAHIGERMRLALADGGEGDILLIVPGQLTLEMERFALETAGVAGSFRLSVYSPARLYERIFAEAGGGKLLRADERGRAMLVRAAIDDIAAPLPAYERARGSAGFAPLAAKQIADCKEAGLSPDDLRALAKRRAGEPTAEKLEAIATLYEAYEARLSGAGLDEEAARREALSRIGLVRSFQGARAFFYGFDLLTQPIAECALALCGVCAETSVYLELRKSANARDWRLYEPAQRSYERALALLRAAGAGYSREALDESFDRRDELRYLGEELFMYPSAAFREKPERVALRACRNPLDEAEHIASEIRSLVREKGWRYRDFAVACQDAGALYAPLRRAFALYDIPAFFAESRPASAHPLAASLLCALRAAAKRPAEDDMRVLLSAGYSGLRADDADFLANFAFERGIRGSRWLRAYAPRGEDDADGVRFERARERFAAPIFRMRAGLKAPAARDRLNAVYTYLQDCGAYAATLRSADALSRAGRGVEAAEGGQVWSKILLSLDQMAALFEKSAPPSGEAIAQMLEAALRATDIKPLPQSADAVAAGSLSHMKTRPVRVVFIAGATDEDEPAQAGLLTDAELRSLSDEIWFGPGREERALMRMLAAKRCLSCAEERVCVTYSESDIGGAARRPGSLARGLRAVFPKLRAEGGVAYDPAEAKARLSHPNAALLRVGEALRSGGARRDAEVSALRALRLAPGMRKRVDSCLSALRGDALSPSISPALAGKLYNGPKRVSVSRLERFAACPMRHFIDYGARPKELREYGIDPRDAGMVCHDALERFAADGPADSPERAIERMDAITSELTGKYLPGFAQSGALESAETENLRRVARRAALSYCRQMASSRFRQAAEETAFRGEDAIPLSGAALEGRIDRVDLFEADGRAYLRVIDYKRGAKKLQIAKVYYGLQLQLIVYLLAASRAFGAGPAAVLYFNVSDPLVDTRETDAERVESARARILRMDGLLLDDEEIVIAMANPPGDSLPVSQNADGTLRASDKLLSPDDFALLARRAVEQAESALRGIRLGEVGARPAVFGSESPCDSCAYACVCRRDSQSGAAKERRLETLGAKEALNRLRRESRKDADEP